MNTTLLSSASSSSPFVAPLTCQHGGVLLQRPVPGGSAGEFEVECACANGWSGARCEYRDRCHSGAGGARRAAAGEGGHSHASGPCLNGGTCLSTMDGILCRCAPGWIGLDCSVKAPCNETSCAPHGKCMPVQFTPPVEEEEEHPAKKLGAANADAESEKVRFIGGVVDARCQCNPGWTGERCQESLSAQCAAIPPCTPLSGPDCGCSLALRLGCHWCLEEGRAYAPHVDKADSLHRSCLAGVSHSGHCPSPSAQSIRRCAIMDGTPFGWCAVNGGPRGYAVEGNPSSPAVGARKCHHWVWSASGCRADFTTGPQPPTPPPPPMPPVKSDAGAAVTAVASNTSTIARCQSILPCVDSETAGSQLCGCQAAMSVGCDWCLEQNLAIPHGGNSSCIARAIHPRHCPSQQAQVVRQCRGVGGLPFGWCALQSSDGVGAGFALDGTARAPASKHRCAAWIFHSDSCPDLPSPLSLAAMHSQLLDEDMESPNAAEKQPQRQHSSHLGPDGGLTNEDIFIAGMIIAASIAIIVYHCMPRVFGAESEYEEIDPHAPYPAALL